MHEVMAMKDIKTSSPWLACMRTLNFRDYLFVCEFHIHLLVIASAQGDSLYLYSPIVTVYIPEPSSFLSPSKPF
jgi:hypothetical protein